MRNWMLENMGDTEPKYDEKGNSELEYLLEDKVLGKI
jgi:hypothetical protein